MKNQSAVSLRTSRPQILLVSAAFSALLIACSPAQAQTVRSVAKPVKAKPLRSQIATKPNRTRQVGNKSDHRPPFIFDESSLLIGSLEIGEGREQMKCAVNADTTVARPYTCTRNLPPRTPAKVLSVAVTKNDGSVGYHKRPLGRTRWEIRIWLEKEVSDGVFEPVSSNDDPQLVVKDSYTIEIDKLTFTPENCRPTHVPERPCKYEHPGYPESGGTVKPIRIGRIDLVKNDRPLTQELSPDRLRVSGMIIPD